MQSFELHYDYNLNLTRCAAVLGKSEIKISFIFFQLQTVSKGPEEFAEGRVDNSFNTSQPWVMCYVDKDGTDEYQLFVVVDRRILMEVESSSFPRALFMLLCTHYAFDIDYKASQKLFYTFLEEFCLGTVPSKKSKKYRTVVKELFD